MRGIRVVLGLRRLDETWALWAWWVGGLRGWRFRFKVRET